MRIRHNLDTRLGPIADIDTTRHADLTNAEISKASDYELRAHDYAEARPRVFANSHVYSDIGLLVTHVQLQRSAADGEVGALLLNIAVATTGEISSRVFSRAAGLRPVESEMCERDWNEGESEDGVGEHFGGGVLGIDSQS